LLQFRIKADAVNQVCMPFALGQITVEEFNQKYMAARKVSISLVLVVLMHIC